MNHTYVPGDFWVRCDRTGFRVLASDTRMEWNGLRVRKQSWEARHPQDTIRARPDDPSVPNPRSGGEDRFLATNEVSASDL